MSSRNARRWTVIVASVFMAAAALVLAFMLVFATENHERFEQHFEWLYWVNVSLAGLLTLVIVLALGRLYLRIRRRKFGSLLLLKLVGIFATVAVIPGLLIYGVSYQFVARSIETWFDVRVEGALEAGLNLGRGTLDTLARDLGNKTQVVAERLGTNSRRGPEGQPTVLELEEIREQLGAESVSMIADNGSATSVAGTATDRSLTTERLPASWRQEARNKGVMAQIDGLEDAGKRPRVVALAWLPDRSFSLQAKGWYLYVVQALPADLVDNALNVQTAYQEYQQRALGRQGLRRMYIGTLTLTLVLAVFAALGLAALLGQQLARPLLLLAEGVGDVARGDLSPKPIFASKDELGGLTRDFAAMVQQLADARSRAARSARQLDNARARVQTILDNLNSGVIVFDAQGHIDTVNPGATRILRAPLSAYRGQPLSAVPGLQDLARGISDRFAVYASDPEPGERQQWQESFERPTADPDIMQTLLVRGADLPSQAHLIVFDDISELVSAQRSKAWGEVARRVAHEIKNPLTPIQLSAERLQMKLEDKLDEASRGLLHRSVNTIVNQVQALKRLINEFRDFARLPTSRLAPLDLNALVQEVLGLYGQAIESGMLLVNLEADLPHIEGDATLLRQVVHNLLQNALDAVQDAPALGRAPQVSMTTAWRGAHDGNPPSVRLIIRDNGPGFPEKVLQRAFEPYVTTKHNGTGLGLAVVKKIADEHGALIRLRNLSDSGNPSAPPGSKGAQVSLSFSKLSSNQSQGSALLSEPPA
ncbi:HAMP domain-containing protein [Aquabacterium lacunae]|uniref:histidine kinase n=1 Tax=Aquabacterium lacunae TaxID=2528630 RepID=A0A4V2JG26_9BURK|nr:ATP-binding protein [Aquabacterium lacunae]TBO34436.1 HAMP domain-containing protein [Aquabacterium lacunae]